MSAPLESAEFKTLFVGNAHDDDAAVFEKMVEQSDAPAIPVPEPLAIPQLVRPKATGRLFTGSFVVDTSWTSPVQIVPLDPNRMHLRLDGYSTAATPGYNDYVSIADMNGTSASTNGTYRLRHLRALTLDDHTGAVWVSIGPITAAFEITWVAVTI